MIHLKLTIMALIWAGGFIAGKVVTGHAGPFTIVFLRFLIATGLLAVLTWRKEKSTIISFPVFVHAVVTAFIGILCYNYTFFVGIKFVEATRGSVIISTIPLVVLVLSVFIFNERLNLSKSLGVVLSVIGAWVVITNGHWESVNKIDIGLGEVYLIACVFCGAAFALFSKQLLKQLSPTATLIYISAIGAAFSFVPALLEMQQTAAQFTSPVFLGNMLYLGIGPSVIAVLFYYEAINTVGTSRATQYMNLMPVFAVVLAIIFLGEQLTGSVVIGGGLVTAGLYLTNLTT